MPTDIAHYIRAVGGFENPGGGSGDVMSIICSPWLVEMGLTDQSKTERGAGGLVPLAPPDPVDTIFPQILSAETILFLI